jgi:hypothetical protein
MRDWYMRIKRKDSFGSRRDSRARLVHTTQKEGFTQISLRESCAIGIRVSSELDVSKTIF